MADDLADIALLTVTYAGDLELCRRLCDSIDRHMPGIRHYLVIDRVDRGLFAPLVSANRVLVETEDLLPELFQTRILGRRVWLTPYGPPVRGWILQQLAKLALTSRLDEKVVVVTDSDAVFVRPLTRDAVLRDGRTRFYHAPGAAQLPPQMKWHRIAARVLGLQPRDYFGADYISTAVPWRPEIVRALLARIRRTTWMPWRMALSWRFRFSEYILYGVFVDHVTGHHQDLVFHADADLCHCSWHYDLDDPAQRQAFIDDLGPHHAAVLIQSNLRLAEDKRAALMNAFEARLATGTAAS